MAGVLTSPRCGRASSGIRGQFFTLQPALQGKELTPFPHAQALGGWATGALLTGSANLLLLPRLCEDLVRRMEVVASSPSPRANSSDNAMASWMRSFPGRCQGSPVRPRAIFRRSRGLRRFLAGGASALSAAGILHLARQPSAVRAARPGGYPPASMSSMSFLRSWLTRLLSVVPLARARSAR